mmetsp:Transcript_16366/g.24784  ORF Transcript_16366/g.24784 Transcript_16366/m.24784 type:complete len:98 (-) Transcript_16366:30-323(-)
MGMMCSSQLLLPAAKNYYYHSITASSALSSQQPEIEALLLLLLLKNTTVAIIWQSCKKQTEVPTKRPVRKSSAKLDLSRNSKSKNDEEPGQQANKRW